VECRCYMCIGGGGWWEVEVSLRGCFIFMSLPNLMQGLSSGYPWRNVSILVDGELLYSCSKTVIVRCVQLPS